MSTPTTDPSDTLLARAQEFRQLISDGLIDRGVAGDGYLRYSYITQAFDDIMGDAMETALANAHLFKAAPALLEACKSAVEQLLRYQHVEKISGQDYDISKLQSAIAAAEAQAPEVPSFEGTRQALDDLNIDAKGEA